MWVELGSRCHFVLSNHVTDGVEILGIWYEYRYDVGIGDYGGLYLVSYRDAKQCFLEGTEKGVEAKGV